MPRFPLPVAARPRQHRLPGQAGPTISSISASACDEGRREQHVVAGIAVDRAAHRVNHQPARHRGGLDARVQLQRRIERRLGRAVRHHFQRHEKAAAADVPDMRMAGEARWRPLRRPAPARAHGVEQIVALDHLLHRKRRGASRPDGRCTCGRAGRVRCPRRSASTISDARAPRRSAGSRRPVPWRWRSDPARHLPARPRTAFRCGPCRTSLRPR